MGRVALRANRRQSPSRHPAGKCYGRAAMNAKTGSRVKRSIRILVAIGVSYTALAFGVASGGASIAFENLEPPAEEQRLMPSETPKELKTRPLRTLWFGHSLMEYGAAEDEGVPPINLPAAVDEIHRLARADGRTTRPEGETVSHYDGPKDLIYWLQGGGDATAKLKDSEKPWDYVIGVGFMHLTLQKGGRHRFRSQKLEIPTAAHHVKGAVRDLVDVLTFGKLYRKTVDSLTLNKYRFIKATNDLGPTSTWLNYVGPVLNDRTENQASVDARFACMVDTAKSAGARAGNVPVGASVRRAEEALRAEGLNVPLQRADRLHYTAHGAFLAANVFYSFLYDVDPTRLNAPESLASYFKGADGKKVRKVLQEIAWTATREAKAGHLVTCGKAHLPVDDEGLRILKGKP